MTRRTKAELIADITALRSALSRLLASHRDYTQSQSRGWPGHPGDYPDLEWSLEIEQTAEAALAYYGAAP